ncbi:MAG TPA: protein kinase [Gemmatimonadales bacterium]|nr:protein kinase [Gemmatimonadales bacterium]
MTNPAGGPSSPGALSGTTLDARYRVGHLIGQGGMSEVYLGHHLALDRPCAIKVIRPERAASPDARTRFAREASAVSRIAHPNVCQTHDFGTTPDGLHYLVLEYLEGRALSALLAGGPLALPRALAITRQCAAGLQACHDAGLVHRDLKPDNVMVVRRGKDEVAVLMDFGIARSLSSPELTRDGLMVGTPEVMSPEQIAGDPVGPESDQYQLALLLVRMLTGKLPFPGETTQERMTSRLTVPPARLAELSPELRVPDGVQRAIARALSRRPGDRFPALPAFVGAMDALPGMGVEPEPPTEILSRRTPRSASPRTRRLARVVVAGAAVAGVLTAWQYLRPEPGAPPSLAVPNQSLDTTPETVSSGVVPPAPSPQPVQPGPVALPSLPSDSLAFSEDPAQRRGAREQAEQVYRSAEAAVALRAEAAFLIAETHRRDGAFGEARTWLQHCLALQERPGCRRLLSLLP